MNNSVNSPSLNPEKREITRFASQNDRYRLDAANAIDVVLLDARAPTIASGVLIQSHLDDLMLHPTISKALELQTCRGRKEANLGKDHPGIQATVKSHSSGRGDAMIPVSWYGL